MNTDKEPTEDMERLNKALQTLGEYFDTVHIFATRHESGEHDGTLRLSVGTGNWFARYGQIRHWLIVEDEASRNNITRTVIAK